jgi:hypothetical protein
LYPLPWKLYLFISSFIEIWMLNHQQLLQESFTMKINCGVLHKCSRKWRERAKRQRGRSSCHSLNSATSLFLPQIKVSAVTGTLSNLWILTPKDERNVGHSTDRDSGRTQAGVQIIK